MDPRGCTCQRRDDGQKLTQEDGRMQEREGNTEGDCLGNRGVGAEGAVLVDTGYPVHGVGLVQGSQKRWERLQAVQVYRLGKTTLSWLPCWHHGGVASPRVPGDE